MKTEPIWCNVFEFHCVERIFFTLCKIHTKMYYTYIVDEKICLSSLGKWPKPLLFVEINFLQSKVKMFSWKIIFWVVELPINAYETISRIKWNLNALYIAICTVT